MYPAFPDVLRTVQQNLMRDIIPDLSTDYAREQATGLLVLLQHLLTRWDRAADTLREENDDLRTTLREMGGTNDTTEHHEPGVGSGKDLIAENRELRQRLAPMIASVPDGSAALRIAERFMARQLEREKVAADAAPIWD